MRTEKRHPSCARSLEEIPQLHKIVFCNEFLYWHTGEDAFGSMFTFGPQAPAEHSFNARDFSIDEGLFMAIIPPGHILATIDTLHNRSRQIDPTSALRLVGMVKDDATFGDRLCSLHFGP